MNACGSWNATGVWVTHCVGKYSLARIFPCELTNAGPLSIDENQVSVWRDFGIGLLFMVLCPQNVTNRKVRLSKLFQLNASGNGPDETVLQLSHLLIVVTGVATTVATSCNQLQPQLQPVATKSVATSCNQLQPDATSCNQLQPVATTSCDRRALMIQLEPSRRRENF